MFELFRNKPGYQNYHLNFARKNNKIFKINYN